MGTLNLNFHKHSLPAHSSRLKQHQLLTLTIRLRLYLLSSMSLAQSCALRSLVSRPTTSAGSRGKLHVRAVLKNPQEPQLSKSSACDLETVQTLQKRCAGLNGADMEACWAEAGCDVDDVTRQFAT